MKGIGGVEDPFVAGLFGTLSWDRTSGSVAATTLGDRAVFSALIDRFQTARGGADRLAVTSFWSQLYFSALIIPAVAMTLTRGCGLPLNLDDTGVTFCSRTGAPLCFHMTPSINDMRLDFSLEPLLHRHVAPLIAILRRHSGLSGRLLWENATWPLIWTLGEMGRYRPACLPDIRRLFEPDICPPCGRRACETMMRAAAEGLPVSRRICCLRYRVPGFGRCQGLCPLT